MLLRCLNIENKREIKPKITLVILGICRSFLLFIFSGNMALAVFWKQCIQQNLSLFGAFVLVRLACYLVSWRHAIPTDGQEYRQPGDHVQASVCVLRARSPSQKCWNACLFCVSALVAKQDDVPALSGISCTGISSSFTSQARSAHAGFGLVFLQEGWGFLENTSAFYIAHSSKCGETKS